MLTPESEAIESSREDQALHRLPIDTTSIHGDTLAEVVDILIGSVLLTLSDDGFDS